MKKEEFTVENVQKIADNIKELKGRIEVLDVFSKKAKSNSYSRRYVKFNCRKHPDIIKEQQLGQLKKGRLACDKCRNEKLSITKTKDKKYFQDKINKRWGADRCLYIKPLENYRAEFYCIKHGKKFDYATTNINNNSFGCSDCTYETRVKIRSLSIEEIRARGLKIFGEKYEVKEKMLTGENRGKLRIFCNEHGEEFYQAVGKFSAGQHGCKECQKKNADKKRKRNGYAKFVRDGKTIHSGANYVYPPEQEYKSKDSELEVYCKDCRKSFVTTYEKHIRENHGCDCQKRMKSKGEILIKNTLIELDIENFEHEYSPGDLKSGLGEDLRFDFYLPDYDLVIEHHGVQHFRAVKQFDGKAGFRKIQESDRKKMEYCIEKGLFLLELVYRYDDKIRRNQIINKINEINKIKSYDNNSY